MTATATPTAQPAKGTTFTLPGPRFTQYDGSPWVLTVTSVRGEVVYFKHPLWHDSRRRMSLALFTERAQVLGVPEAKTADRGPALSPEQCEALHQKAHAAGMAAGKACQPTPMIVQERRNPFDDSSPVVRTYAPVMDGVCGFAWVVVRPGNSSFARWARSAQHAHKGQHGGVHVWVRAFGQSMERKSAYAVAYAEVLTEAGLRAYPDSRQD